ncbi:tetratricopeptide repeat protein [Shewanella dokdonensis]|uniref:Tetratricopeptide repeat protein n=1 Tax=Shewanella dokdonensis TaxID=712036 RepID=A0ABX8DFP2_9GAMM|nr:tetratricopeptide repeat protein [Shewanella dokdonensis]MCL1075170.1 tetratricopeptide repeat protein [Shewanella dokdonensis]QVK23554.1 tetratricopeptide repeat protein [Shewanella dokdonensis]
METTMELTRDNIQQVVELSNQQLVALVFWAAQMPESKTLLQTMEQLAAAFPGQLQLASVNCETQLELASYFQIRSLPTTLLLSQGQPIDGFAGVQSREQIQAMLQKHLPAAWELKLNDAKALLQQGDATAALPLLKDAYAEEATAAVALPYAEACLTSGDLAMAKTLLATIKLADQDGYYSSLMSQLDLAEKAADTPEIRALQQALEASPADVEVLQKLATALHLAHRDEEALALLFTPLSHDLNIGDGAVKQQLLTLLSALGQGNALAGQYRRKLYSLLY